MADAVRKHHPRRQRREMDLLIALRIVTEARVFLHEIVDAAHRPIVGARVDDAHERVELADRADEAAVELVERAFVDADTRLAALGCVPETRISAHTRAERAFRAPDAVARRMDVDEEAEDPRAVRGAVRAGVDVHELVARARRQLAAKLLDRAEARGTERPVRHEVGARAAQKLFDALAVRSQDFLHAIFDGGVGFEARNRIGFRVIADVLHLKLTRQAFTHELQIRLDGQLDGALVEVDDLAAFHRILDIAGIGADEAL